MTIAWHNFDQRTTKVWCDRCEAEIPNFYEMVKRGNVKWPLGNNNPSFLKKSDPKPSKWNLLYLYEHWKHERDLGYRYITRQFQIRIFRRIFMVTIFK